MGILPECQAKYHGQQQAAAQGGVNPEGFCGQGAHHGAQDKEGVNSEILNAFMQKRLFFVQQELVQIFRGIPEISGTHGRGKGCTQNLPEGFCLNGTGKGYHHIGGNVADLAAGNETDGGQQQDFQYQRMLLPGENAGLGCPAADPHGYRDACDEGKNGNQIPQYQQPVAVCQGNGQPGEISRLGIGKDAVTGNVGIGIQKASRYRQQCCNTKGFGRMGGCNVRHRCCTSKNRDFAKSYHKPTPLYSEKIRMTGSEICLSFFSFCAIINPNFLQEEKLP